MDATVAAGFAIFVGAKLLKYWAILSLGVRWTFRVLVPPGSAPLALGPYRLIRHPNYIAVMGEIAGAATIAHAPLAGALVFAALGGFFLLSFHMRDKPHPKAVVVLHALLAVTGVVALLVAAF